MKKVLIISYLYPPLPTIGAQRPYRLAKYLARWGWEPIVLTAKLPGPPPDGIRVIETGYKDVIANMKSRLGLKPDEGAQKQLGIKISRDFSSATIRSKGINLVKDIIAFPDTRRGWYDFAIESASRFLENEMVDMIISSSYPVTAHLIANTLKAKYRVPWVADFRDLWTQNHYYDKFGLIKAFERRLEIRTLLGADALVTANPLAETLSELHPGKKIVCITNGYDSDEFPSVHSELTRKFTVTYTGTLYNGKRDPSMVFEVVRQLINERIIDKNKIEIKFFCRSEDWLEDEIVRHDLGDIVRICDRVPREEALKIQKESQLLLLLRWDKKKEEDIIPGKLFEYFGAGRPIIGVGGRGGAVRDLLETTRAGVYAENASSLRQTLLQYYNEYLDQGYVKNRSNEKIQNYSYEKIAKQYAALLNDIISD